MWKPEGRSISRLLFIALTGFMLVVIVISLVGAISWINKPFANFLVYDFPFTGSMNMDDWAGRVAGIKPFQKIIAVNGHPVWHQKDILDIVREHQPGEIISYTIETSGEQQVYEVPVGIFTLRDFLLVFAVTFVGGIAIFCLGFVVFVLKPDTATSWVFFIYCLFLCLYGVTGFEIQSTYRIVELNYLALCLFPPTLFHLCLIFPERKKILDRWPLAEFLIYLPAIVITIGYQIYLQFFEKILKTGALTWLPSYKAMASVNRLFTFFCVISAVLFVVHSLRRASTSQARQRARMILFGVTIAFGPPGIIMLLGVVFNFAFPWNFIIFFAIFFPAAIAYSIIRHNLFDADLIIRRTVGYAIVTAMIVGAYIGLSLSMNLLLGRGELTQSRWFPISFTVAVILVFNPLRNRIQAVVDRLFFRKDYDYAAVVEKIGGAITRLMGLGDILHQLVDTFLEDMFIDTSSVVLLNADGSQYTVRLAAGEHRQRVEQHSIDRQSPLMAIVEERKAELTRNDVLEDPRYAAVSEDCLNHFDALHAKLLLPMVFQKKVVGLLSLGEKKSGKSYNRADIDLLRTIAHQGAVAIENAMLFQENLEKQRMEEELNIARDLQISMLPAECPEIDGFQIAAVSTQAKEVGGDFYDFIEMDGDRLGIVIGDVTGKSVSGALVMAASRSVFRLLSEDKPSVGDIMIRANRRMKNDTKSGMFVALLYAVIDPANRTLAMCSAGQTQPIYCRADQGQAVFMETEGDNFPLGILDEANYVETRIQLQSGDKVILYTDGIVEAMNADRELFGFERLNASVEKAAGKDARGMLDALLADVQGFVQDAKQHDDMTVIVVSVV
jgi:sigma-B regulation protein RsbU (phosphoserine phosphatase)